MFPLTRSLRLAAAGALVTLTAGSLPARADELAQNDASRNAGGLRVRLRQRQRPKKPK